MDVNTNLREDEFLFPSENRNNRASELVIKWLNKNEIYTINDLINCNQNDFRSYGFYFIRALVQIMRYRYLGEELINDVLLEKEYTKKSVMALTKDLRMLGFGQNNMSNKEMEKNVQLFLSSQVEEPITMEQVLKEIKGVGVRPVSNADFSGFYLGYLEQKRKNDQQDISNPTKEVLEGLKLQLQGLVMMRNGLDKQIEDIQKQIDTLNKGEEIHGR